MGSASELEYHLILAHDLGYLSDSDYEEPARAVEEVKQVLASLIQTLKADR
jgi:four helix bundle protein